MASILDFTQFSFTAEQIRAVRELVYDKVVSAPEIGLIHTVYNNIVFDKEIGFIGRGSKVGVAKQGCDPVAQAFSIATRKITWEPKGWEVYIAQCSDELEQTAAVYSLNTGVSVNDFTNTDYMNIVETVLVEAVKEFMIRLFWFNDVNADTIANGGTLTNGTNKLYFNIINGFFKQILAQVAINPAQRITISENAGATYIAQELDTTNIKSYVQGLVYKASIHLATMTDTFILCTQSFYNAYELYLQGLGQNQTYDNTVNGVPTVRFNGKPLIPIPMWDLIIATDYNTGAKLLNPHRAIYTSKSILAVGNDSEGSFGQMDAWYDKDSRKVKIEQFGKSDAKILNPEMFTIAI